jgi:hypothetical protein
MGRPAISSSKSGAVHATARAGVDVRGAQIRVNLRQALLLASL